MIIIGGVPVDLCLRAATCCVALRHGGVVPHNFPLETLLVGLLFAFAPAVLSSKWMVSYLNRHGLAIFGYYWFAIGLFTTLLLTAGWL